VTAAIHSVIYQAILNTVPMPEKMSEFVSDSKALPDPNVFYIDSNAIAAESAFSDVAEYLPGIRTQIHHHHGKSQLSLL
jgi:hypothetical protein